MSNVINILEPGSAVGEKAKNGFIEEKFRRAVACGGGKGGGTCWRHAFDASVYDTRFWYHALIGQLTVLLTVSRSFNITLLQLGERCFKTRISSK